MEDPKAVSSQIAVKDSSVDIIISHIFNASEVPLDLIETVRQYQQRLITKGVSQSVDLKAAIVNDCKIYIGNISTPLDLNNTSEQELLKELQLQSLSSVAETGETTQSQTGKLNWQFQGINQFQSITIRIHDKTWQVEFSRLQRPFHSGSKHLGDQKELKTKAHRNIYDSLCVALKPLSKEEIKNKVMGNMVVLQGGSGLGKTHCAQHYFYHRAAKEHQMVAWLSGKSQESFLQGWKELAQQLRNIQTSQSESSDDEVIKEWCENQLGQWLLIIDEVNIDAAWLNDRLPKRGGHVLITTHQPNYGFELGQVKSELLNLIPISQDLEQSSNLIPQTQTNPQLKHITISFIPLSNEDSKELLQGYVGNYWQATGYPQEQKAIKYLIEVLGGYPSALTQMALLVHKKCISFERLVEQFKQPILRNYLLTDTVFDQLKDQTFMLRVKKGWEQLLNYFNKRYSQITSEHHAQHLKQFIEILQQEMTKQTKTGKEEKERVKDGENEEVEKIENKEIKAKKEDEKKQKAKIVESEASINQQIDGQIIQSYWQAVEASCENINFNIEELIDWLHCLPIYYDKANNQWQISQAGLTALLFQNNPNSTPNAQHLQIVPIDKEAVEAKLAEVAKTPFLPREIDISMRLEDASIKNAEIDILTIRNLSEFKVWQLPTVNPYFIPRPKLTDKLKAKLPQKNAGEESAKLLLTAATGMGGIGKTELARHFVTNKELSDHYQRRFWLTATAASHIRNEFMQLAVYLTLIEDKKYIEDKELIHLVHRWLSINPGWLMVLDNADDYNSIVSWIPTEGGAVLVTTREPTPGTMRPEQIIPVPLLEPEEAVDWLYQLSNRNNDNLSEQEKAAAKQLVDDLGYLPLAISQAAAYLREQSQISIAEYQTRFITLLSDTTLASQEASENIQNNPDIKSRKVVANTWKLSLRAIEAYVISHNIPNIAEEILSSCAYYAPKNIPLLLLEGYLKNFCKVEYTMASYLTDEYVGQLVRYSLLERNGTVSVVSVHRLVQEVIREELGEVHTFLFKSIEILHGIYPYSKREMKDYSIKRILQPHLSEELKYLDNYLNKLKIDTNNFSEVKKEVVVLILLKNLTYLSDSYRALGDPYNQKVLLERLLSLKVNYYGKNSSEIARTLNDLSVVYGELGDANKQKELLYQALPILKSTYGETHLLVAMCLNNLGYTFGNLGDLLKQKELLQEAFKIYENPSSYTKYPFLAAGTLVNLGNAYGDLGDAHQKKILLEQALYILKNYYGKDHLEVATTLVNLGNTYGELGDAHKQKQLLEEALTIKEVYYGKDHPQIFLTLLSLSSAYESLGEVHKQKELLEKILLAQKKYYGREHLHIAVTLSSLGDCYGELGDIFNRKELVGQALKIQERYYKKDHPLLATTLTSLGDCYRELGDVAKGKELLERALVIQEANYGKDHVRVAMVLTNLGSAYSSMGEMQISIKLFEKALSIIETFFGEDHVRVATVLTSLSTAQGGIGKVHEQKELLERALTIQAVYYGEDHPRTANTLASLGDCYRELGDVSKGKELLERALTIQEAFYEKDNIHIAIILNHLGNVYGALGKAQDQKRLLERALAIKESYYGKNSPRVATSLVNLGNAYDKLGNTNKQKELLEHALLIQKAYYGNKHFQVAIVLGNLGNAHGNLGNLTKKKELLEEALGIEELYYGKNHPQIALTLNNLANAYGNLCKTQEQRRLLERALAIQESYYGKDHPKVALTLNNLGNAHAALGEIHLQQQLLEKALSIESGYYGENHPEYAITLINLANSYGKLGYTDKQLRLLKQALAIQELYYDKNHPQVAITLCCLGVAYGNLGDLQNKKVLIERALSIQESYYGKNHAQIAVTLGNLSEVYGAIGDKVKQKKLLKRVLTIQKENYPPKHYETARTLEILGNYYGNEGNTLKQKKLLEEALEIEVEHYGLHHPEVAITLLNLGACCFHQEEVFSAISHVQYAYSIFLHHPKYGESHPYTQKAKQLLDEIRLQQSAIPTLLSINLRNPIENQVKLNPTDWQPWLRLADQHYEQGNLEQAIQCYNNVILISPENIYAHHNLACLHHVINNIALAEQHFRLALKIKANAAMYCDYGFLLLKQKRYEEAAKNFLTVICFGNDGSGLMYGKLEKKILDEYLQQEITTKSNLEIKPFFIAHYWLIQCFGLLNDYELRDFYLIQLAKFVQKFPSAIHYRILEYAYRLLGDSTEKVDEIIEATLLQKNTKGHQEEQKINFSNDNLNELTDLVEKSPTALRYRLLSYIYSAKGNEEQAQEYMALAMSLETTLESQATQQKFINERTTNYNPTLFGGNKATSSLLGNSPQQEFSSVELLLRKAKILPKVMQNKEMVEVKFINHKLIQQFADELHKIGISNLGMKDEPRKPDVIIGGESKEDEYIILLTANEYNKIMKEKDAYAKLTSNQNTQSQLSFIP